MPAGLGQNGFTLDGMQAAILSAKLPHLAQWTSARQDAARVYDAGLNQIEDVVVPEVAPDRSQVYHLYTIKHPRRDALAAHRNANGEQTAPTALPFLAAIRGVTIAPNNFRMRIATRGAFCRCQCLRRSCRRSRTT